MVKASRRPLSGVKFALMRQPKREKFGTRGGLAGQIDQGMSFGLRVEMCRSVGRSMSRSRVPGSTIAGAIGRAASSGFGIRLLASHGMM